MSRSRHQQQPRTPNADGDRHRRSNRHRTDDGVAASESGGSRRRRSASATRADAHDNVGAIGASAGHIEATGRRHASPRSRHHERNYGMQRHHHSQSRIYSSFSPHSRHGSHRHHHGHGATWSTNVTPSATSVSAAMLAMKSTARMGQVMDDQADERCLSNSRQLLLCQHLESLRGLCQVVSDESWMFERK